MNFMSEAFKEARIASSNGEVPVGCVFIYKNEIIARGGNFVNATKNATRHAEFICIDLTLAYCEKNRLNYHEIFPEIEIYVTVEPCIMCATALCNLKVKEITYGCTNDRFGGVTILNVQEILQGTSTKFIGGIRAKEAMDLLKEFYKGENPSAPVPKAKRKSEKKPS